jgi:hypothetical protein
VRRALEAIPNVRVVAEEYPVRYLNGSAIDLLVEIQGQLKYLFPLECKRAYATTKQWVFFQDSDVSRKFLYSFSGSDCNALNASALIAAGVAQAVEGIQVHKKTENKGDKFVSDPTPIWDATFQACKVTHGFIINEIRERKKPFLQISPNDFSTFPLVITTAPLFYCSESSQIVDLLTGNHQGEASFQKVGWILWNFPFAPPLTTAGDHLVIQSEEYIEPIIRGNNAKEGVIFVNAASLTDFILFLQALIT